MSRGRLITALGLCLCGVSPAVAGAATVVRLPASGPAQRASDPYLAAMPWPPVPRRREQVGSPASSTSIDAVLVRLHRPRAISTGQLRHYRGVLQSARASLVRLRGSRAVELGAVLSTLGQIASWGRMSASRLPLLFLTLDRNRSWWSRGPRLGAGQRVEFAGSGLVWEYYPGRGIQLQVLGSFGKADGLFTAGRSHYPQMLSLLSELIPLASRRAGGVAWEYVFSFDGGLPPWTSAMSQATAVEALSRAFRVTGRRSYLQLAHRALPLFSAAPPVGVGVRTATGERYLLYSFDPAPTDAVLNGFLQTLIGLYDYAGVSGDAGARALFRAGDAEARRETPRYDTGAWSLYQPGQEASLDYHRLVTGFLQELCARVRAAVYCRTAARFEADLHTPPRIVVLTHGLRARRSGRVAFRLSKISRVAIFITRGGRNVLLTGAGFPRGTHRFAVPPLAAGRYGLRLAGTDLAGNLARVRTTLVVS